ncbi:MAG: HD domain-containing protein [Eubacterium sp.]|nr:HD domain-containing protein [Eubacterium sp.]
MKYINTFLEGEQISDIYYCKQKTQATTKAGKSYYSLILQDKTGSVDAKVWELSNAIEHFEVHDFIRVEARVTSFNNQLQLNVSRIRRAEVNEYVLSDYMPCSEFSTDEMMHELNKIIEGITNESLKALLNSFFGDKAFLNAFVNHSAAKSIHHGFVGGLLQHTLAVTKICRFIASSYPIINKDLLITSAICHDIGKVEEIADFPVNDYTDAGNLMGHIVIGAMMIRDKIRELREAGIDFSDVLEGELIHCILAHHGELEYGSPKKPALIEAVVLSMADNMDAKIESFTEILNDTGNSSEWLGFNRQFEANIRKTLS